MEEIFFKNEQFTWYNLEKPSEETIQKYREQFGLTAYTLDDANEIGHLPKFEHSENFDFILLRFYVKNPRSNTNQIREFSHKIGIFKGKDFLITIHQKKVPFWQEIKNELALKSNGSSNQLFYKIAEHALFSYQAPSERIAKQIELYEESLFANEKELKINLKKLYQLKRESSACSKLLMLTRDVLNEFKVFTKNPASFKNLHEMNLKLLHLHNQNTEDIHSLFTLTLSFSDQRSNEIMKVLTVFSAFFLPLTFITGFYGMNFDNLPGLNEKAGFYLLSVIMIITFLLIFFWFKRKRFL